MGRTMWRRNRASSHTRPDRATPPARIGPGRSVPPRRATRSPETRTSSSPCPQVGDVHRISGDSILDHGDVPGLRADPDADPRHRRTRLADLILRQRDRLGPASNVDPDPVVGAAVDDPIVLATVAMRAEGDRLVAEQDADLAAPGDGILADQVVGVAMPDRDPR